MATPSFPLSKSFHSLASFLIASKSEKHIINKPFCPVFSMSTNQGPEYFAAEKHYLQAKTDEEKIMWLEEMIRNFKKHKGSENMLSEIKRRLKKFREKQEIQKKKS